MKQMTHKILFITYDDIQSLDLFGPMEVFATAQNISRASYEWKIASFSEGPITTEAGTRILPDVILDKSLPVDTIIFCGGQGARTKTLSGAQIEMLVHLCNKAERIVGICTGSYLISQLGLANDLRMATHWRYAKELARLNPALTVDADVLYVQDGKVWTSAGVTAGIDLALALVAGDYGQSVATSVARNLVVYVRRTGGQAQFSEVLKLQSNTSGRIAPVLEWAMENISRDLSVEVLAEKASLSPRQFTRIFKSTTGMPPAKYVEYLRLDKARLILTEGQHRIDEIAQMIGYKNTDSFRRAFERKFSICPSLYQKQFAHEL